MNIDSYARNLKLETKHQNHGTGFTHKLFLLPEFVVAKLQNPSFFSSLQHLSGKLLGYQSLEKRGKGEKKRIS